MRKCPKAGITSVRFKWHRVPDYDWHNCGFHTGGGSYMDFQHHRFWHRARHFYFRRWCFLSVYYVTKEEEA